MKTYIVTYGSRSGEVQLAKLEANNYGEASDRAEEVIAFINEKLNVERELISIVSINALEDWTRD